MLRILLATAVLLLAGCVGPSEGTELDSEVPEVDEEGPAVVVRTWEGEVTGVGAKLPVLGGAMVGSFDLPGEVTVDVGATSLTVELARTSGVSTNMYLGIEDGLGDHHYAGGLPAITGDTLVHHMEDPVAGIWNFMVYVEGAGNGQGYEMTVTVNYT